MCKHWACHRRQDGALYRSRLLLGAAAEAIGVVVLVVGMADASLAAFLVGGGLAGAGVGVLFKSALARRANDPARCERDWSRIPMSVIPERTRGGEPADAGSPPAAVSAACLGQARVVAAGLPIFAGRLGKMRLALSRPIS